MTIIRSCIKTRLIRTLQTIYEECLNVHLAIFVVKWLSEIYTDFEFRKSLFACIGPSVLSFGGVGNKQKSKSPLVKELPSFKGDMKDPVVIDDGVAEYVFT